jgi:WD40 repeat protein
VKEIAISHDGSQVATADKDRLRRWTAGGGPPQTLDRIGILGPGFSPDGRWLMTVPRSLFLKLQLLRADGTAEPVQLPEVENAAWAPDLQRLAATSADGRVEVYRIDGSARPLELRGHDGSVVAVAFDHRGARIATAAADGTLRVWSAVPGGGQVTLYAGEPGIDMVIDTVRFSPDGTRVLTAAHDKTARVLPADGVGDPIVLRHDANVHSAEWTSDGSRVLTAATDEVRMWPTGGGEAIVVADPADDITLASLSPDRSRVAVGTVVGAWIFDVGTGRSSKVGRRVTTNDLRWRSDGELILAYPKGVAEVVPVEAGGAPRELVTGGGYARIDLSADGARMVSGALDAGELRVWRGADLAEDAAHFRQVPGLSAIAISADGRRIAASTQRDSERVWRRPDERPIELGGATDTVFALAFSPDGRRLAAGSADGYVRIYELEWRPLAAALEGATTACLPVDARVAHLGESRVAASRRFAACERRHLRAESAAAHDVSSARGPRTTEP